MKIVCDCGKDLIIVEGDVKESWDMDVVMDGPEDVPTIAFGGNAHGFDAAEGVALAAQGITASGKASEVGLIFSLCCTDCGRNVMRVRKATTSVKEHRRKVT